MEKTNNFTELDDITQQFIEDYSKRIENTQLDLIPLSSEGSRSKVYEIKGKDVVLKELNSKGARDFDIEALKDLEGIHYFPKMYAYEKGKYLFIEKVKGKDLVELLLGNNISDDDLRYIKELLKDAYSKMISKERKDYDFKLEHIFWDEDTRTISWIDMSICEHTPHVWPSKEEDLQRFLEGYVEKLTMYRRSI